MATATEKATEKATAAALTRSQAQGKSAALHWEHGRYEREGRYLLRVADALPTWQANPRHWGPLPLRMNSIVVPSL
jgi:hypothetical protein